MNVFLTHYHIQCDPYLGIGRCSIRIISCDFIVCINAMDLPWGPYLVPKDQSRYSSAKKFKYYPILGEHNDWVIMDFIDKFIDEEEYEEV